MKAVAKILLMDWQRGKIPFFVPPPISDEKMEENKTDEKPNDVYFILKH